MSSQAKEKASSQTQARLNSVKAWVAKIKRDKKKHERAFTQMREDMDFVGGLQWKDQENLTDEERYIANLTIQMVNQKIASLYARNPKVDFTTRERMHYMVWDERLESLASAIMAAKATGGQDPASMAVILDYENGRRFKELLQNLGKTLKILYKYQCDQVEPSFKVQMKQLVCRTVVCGVSYVRTSFLREYVEQDLTTTKTDVSVPSRIKMAQSIARSVADGDIDEDSPRLEELRLLLNSLKASAQSPSENVKCNMERLDFDFPSATSIIPDEHCTNLKGFINANHVTQEYTMRLSEANAFFETDMDVSTVTHTTEDGKEVPLSEVVGSAKTDTEQDPVIYVWEVCDKRTKTSFYLTEGWPDYLSEPQPVEPATRYFWPWRTLLFNHIENDLGCKVSIFPPSDVRLGRFQQKELNRQREALRTHRKNNAPKTGVRKGVLSEMDKDNLMSADDCSCIELEGLASGEKVNDVLQKIAPAPIDPAVYDSSAVMQDFQGSTGVSELNLGISHPQHSKKGQTATQSAIEEQSRMTKSSSNVDDLDDLQSELAQDGGEKLLYEMSPENVKEIVGAGAVWPLLNRGEFAKWLFLEVEAASSGRPNKALETANFRELAPLLMQSGANPFFMIREGIKRLDDKLDPVDAYPLLPTQNVPPGQPVAPGTAAPGAQALPQSTPPQGQESGSPMLTNGQGQPQVVPQE